VTFKRTKQAGQNRAQRTIRSFNGVHGGMGRTDAHDSMASIADDVALENNILRRRPGRGVGTTFDEDIDSIFEINLAGVRRAGMIVGGSLQIRTLSEVLT